MIKNFLFVTLLLFSARSFADVKLKFDRNVSPALRNLIESDLNYIFSLVGDAPSPLHQKIWGPVDGANYKHIFESAIKKVKLGSCTGGLVCYIPFDPTTLYINPKYYPGVEPMMARIAQYFWVVRVPLHSPVSCPTPFVNENGENIRSIYNGLVLAGEPDCDDSIIGPYASISIMLSNISRSCRNCSNEVMQDADVSAKYFLQRVIDPKAHDLIVQDK